MVVGFVVVFVTPYLLVDIGAGLGYIWGGFAFSTSIWAWLFMPELKVSLTKRSRRYFYKLIIKQGRNLEEIDQLFEARISAWQFHKFQTDGLSHDLAVHKTDKTNTKIKEQSEDVERTAATAPIGNIKLNYK